MIRLLAYVDEPVLQLGLRIVLTTHSGIAIHFVETPAQLAKDLLQWAPDILIWNITPETNLHSIEDIRVAAPSCKVILWVHSISPEIAALAVDAGARGILRKTMPNELLLKCIRKVNDGEFWLETAVTQEMMAHPTVHLSRRESQLVQLMMHGLKNKEISTALGLTENSVKVYVSRLLHKLHLKDRFDLALYGLKRSGAMTLQHGELGDETGAKGT